MAKTNSSRTRLAKVISIGAPSTLQLVPDLKDDKTVDCLEKLLLMAQKGEIYGLAFVALVKGRRFIRDSAGECERNPLYTRGLIAALDDLMKEKMAT